MGATKWRTYKRWLKGYAAGPKWPQRAQIVAVQWQDATYTTDVEDSGLAGAITVGIVVDATDQYIKTAAEFFHDRTVRDVTTIPAGMVQNIHPLGHTDLPV